MRSLSRSANRGLWQFHSTDVGSKKAIEPFHRLVSAVLAHFAREPLWPGLPKCGGDEACNIVIKRISEPISQIDGAECLILWKYVLIVLLAVEPDSPVPDVLNRPFASEMELP